MLPGWLLPSLNAHQIFVKRRRLSKWKRAACGALFKSDSCSSFIARQSVHCGVVWRIWLWAARFSLLPRLLRCHIVECGGFESRIVRHKVLVLPQLGKYYCWIWDSVAKDCDRKREDSDMWGGQIDGGWDLPGAREMEGLRWKLFTIMIAIIYFKPS